MSFHEDIPMNKKDESRINKKFHAERVKTRAGGKETPNFLSKMGSMSAKAIRSSTANSTTYNIKPEKYKRELQNDRPTPKISHKNKALDKAKAPSIDKKEYKGITKALKGAMKD